jgi:hypothetical protein
MSLRDETFTVAILRDSETGVAIVERWLNSKGILHRPDGPAYIEREEETGKVIEEDWYRNGRKVKASTAALRTTRRIRHATRALAGPR